MNRPEVPSPNLNSPIFLCGQFGTKLPNLKKTANISGYTVTRAHKNGRLEEERVTPIEARSRAKLLNRTKNRTPGHVRA